MDGTTLLPLDHAPVPTSSDVPLPNANDGIWWHSTWAHIAMFLFIMVGVLAGGSLLMLLGGRRINRYGDWQSWEGHDMRFYNRHPEYHPGNRHRRPNTAPPTPHGGSAWRGWRNLFAINFNWRPSMMRITFPHFRRNRNENQALPLAHQRQQVDDTWIPLSDRAQIPSRPSRTLMSERDLVRRDDVISAGLAREGL